MQCGNEFGDWCGREVISGILVFPLCKHGGKKVRAAFFSIQAVPILGCIEAVLAGMYQVTVAADDPRDHEHLPVLDIRVDVDAADAQQVPYRQQDWRQEAE